MLVSGPVGPRAKPGIWVISVVGISLRKLQDDADGATISPDETEIAFVRQHQIWVMGADGSNAHLLFAPPAGAEESSPLWLPRSDRLSYFEFVAGSKNAGKLLTRKADGSDPMELIAPPALNDYAWAPDGRLVYSSSERPPNQADSNLWTLRVDPATGRARGNPHRLTDWRAFNFVGLSFSGDGKHLVFDNFRYRGVVEAQPLPASTPPVQVSFDDRADSTGGWSRDSKAVYYVSDRSGSDNIYRQIVGEHSPEDVVESPQRKSPPALSPDGNWVLYQAWPPDTDFNSPVSGSLMRIPIGGGSAETVMPLQVTPFPSPQLPDFRCAQRPGGVCVLAQLRSGQVVFSTFDPAAAGGKLRDVVSRKLAGFTWDLSPDGTQLLIAPRNESAAPMEIIPLNGASSSAFNVHDWAHLIAVAWSADSKSVYASSFSPSGDTVLRVDLQGNATPLFKGGYAAFNLSPAPDGHALAYTELRPNSNIWSMEFPGR